MNFRVWTPRYITNRIKVVIHQQLHRSDPWLTADSITILNKHLQSSDNGLEWGSGRSTIWFGKRINTLVSVETNREWHEIVSNKIAHEGLHNIKLKFTAGKTYSNLLEQTKNISNDSLDFVLIDGAVNRHLTTEISIPLLKKGGLLIIDNINWFMPSPYGLAPDSITELRPEWTAVSELIQNWKSLWTTNGVTDTAIWFKP